MSACKKSPGMCGYFVCACAHTHVLCVRTRTQGVHVNTQRQCAPTYAAMDNNTRIFSSAAGCYVVVPKAAQENSKESVNDIPKKHHGGCLSVPRLRPNSPESFQALGGRFRVGQPKNRISTTDLSCCVNVEARSAKALRVRDFGLG